MKMLSKEELDRLESLSRKGTPPPWFALWRDDGTGTHAFEFVGVPTAGNILTGCDANPIAGIVVRKSSEHQARAHADIKLIEAMRIALPSLIAQARLAPVWRKGTEPPETNKACLCIRNGKEYEDFRRSTGEWFETGDAPDLWCYKPTPPESSDE